MYVLSWQTYIIIFSVQMEGLMVINSQDDCLTHTTDHFEFDFEVR